MLIPVQCEYYALEGIADLMTTIKLTAAPEPRAVYRAMLTMYDGDELSSRSRRGREIF
ncbi:MAG: hypothetical protein ACLUEK_14395 [Oscillospiraceae bacterium]